MFPGGRSHKGGRATVPDLTVGKICDQGGEICHLRLGSLGPPSPLHCKLLFVFILFTQVLKMDEKKIQYKNPGNIGFEKTPFQLSESERDDLV